MNINIEFVLVSTASVLELVDAAIPAEYLAPMRQTILKVEGVKVCTRMLIFSPHICLLEIVLLYSLTHCCHTVAHWFSILVLVFTAVLFLRLSITFQIFFIDQ